MQPRQLLIEQNVSKLVVLLPHAREHTDWGGCQHAVTGIRALRGLVIKNQLLVLTERL